MTGWNDSGWWQVATMWIGAVLAAVSAWGFWSLRHSFVTRGEFDALEQKNEERDVQIESRVANLETRVDHLPTTEKLHSVEMKLTKLCAETEGLRDMMNRIDQRLGVLYEHQLNGETQ